MSDGIVYAVKPTGHETPDAERKVVRPNRELETAFKFWLKTALGARSKALSGDQLYGLAVDMLQGLEKITVEEAHGLLTTCDNPLTMNEACRFVSAVYNVLCDEPIIDFNLSLPHPPSLLASYLDDNKVFVNRSCVGEDVGLKARGTVVNYGTAGKKFGNSARLSINVGESERLFGYESGVAINLGVIKDASGLYVNNEGLAIHAGKDTILYPNTLVAGGIVCIGPIKKGGRFEGMELDQKWCQQHPFIAHYFEQMRLKLEEGRDDPQKVRDFLLSLKETHVKDTVRLIVDMNENPARALPEAAAARNKLDVLNQLIAYHKW